MFSDDEVRKNRENLSYKDHRDQQNQTIHVWLVKKSNNLAYIHNFSFPQEYKVGSASPKIITFLSSEVGVFVMHVSFSNTWTKWLINFEIKHILMKLKKENKKIIEVGDEREMCW